jgi:hypothetical protein
VSGLGNNEQSIIEWLEEIVDKALRDLTQQEKESVVAGVIHDTDDDDPDGEFESLSVCCHDQGGVSIDTSHKKSGKKSAHYQSANDAIAHVTRHVRKAFKKGK